MPVQLLDFNGRPLDTTLAGHFRLLKGFLLERQREGRLLFLYRGEQYRNLEHRLAAEPISADELYDRLFYFGDKARHFTEAQGNVQARDFLRNICDVSPSTFEYIFDRIAQAIAAPALSGRVTENTSVRFRGFFGDPENRDFFVSRILGPDNRLDVTSKLKLRDYYLYLLHVAGRNGVREPTMFVSTTTDRWIARRFTLRAASPARMIFHYFIPQPYYQHAVAPWIVDHHQHIAVALELPTFHALGLFPSQKEVCVKGALFPQFLLGVELVAQKQFIVNPHALELRARSFEEVACNGIPIDQGNFANRIFDTGYSRWGYHDGAGNFAESDVEFQS